MRNHRDDIILTRRDYSPNRDSGSRSAHDSDAEYIAPDHDYCGLVPPLTVMVILPEPPLLLLLPPAGLSSLQLMKSSEKQSAKIKYLTWFMKNSFLLVKKMYGQIYGSAEYL